MTHKKSLLFGAVFSIVGAVTLVSGVKAEDAIVRTPTNETEEHSETTQKQRIEDQKTVLKERYEAAKETRQNKLEDKRLATCEKRSSKINSIVTQGTDQSRKHLAVFQKIEERVEKFYVDKQLTADGYEAAVANADEKEAVAIAAIEASAETTFNCATADGAKPGDATKQLVNSRHEALKAYRTAIKELIQLVKKAHGEQQSAKQTEGVQ